VIGFDGSQIADIMRPRLTTIKQPVDRISECTVDLLLEVIEEQGAAKSKGKMKTIVLSHELLVQGSCRSIET
jgi:DNA-binding LacI/PurR family transcriptional regulator